MTGRIDESELPRPVKTRPLSAAPVTITADRQERAALAQRFAISSVEKLQAVIGLRETGTAIMAEGTLHARIIQTCVVSGEDFPVAIEETLQFRFVPVAAHPLDEAEGRLEIELDALDCDEIDYSGDSFDLGEAVAQSLGLAIDVYAKGPMAEAVRKDTGITADDAQAGPLAEALAALKKE